MTHPTTTPLPSTPGHAAVPFPQRKPASAVYLQGFFAVAGLVLALASPAPSWAQQAAAPADKTAPKLSKSYVERVEELQDRVGNGKLAQVGGTIVPTTERKTVAVDKVNSAQTWWQYEDDTTFIHIENTTGQPIAGLELAYWIDSCSQKAQPPNIVHVVLKKPLKANAQAVVKIPPSKLLHTRNEVSCLSVRGAWGG